MIGPAGEFMPVEKFLKATGLTGRKKKWGIDVGEGEAGTANIG